MASITVGALAFPAAWTNDVVEDGLDPVAVALLPIGEPVVGVALLVGRPVAADVPVLDAVDEGEPVPLQVLPASTFSKLAQVMRVLFPKWNTKLRFPKKAPMPSFREAKLSV